MAPSDPQAGRVDPDEVPALSQLLHELARAPEADLRGAWAFPPRAGDRVGRFEIRGELGRGGFGTVHEALDPELGRIVAIKTLRPRRSQRELGQEWIRQEAEATARLAHPAIVTLHDFGTCDRGPFLVMERLEGRTLADRLGAGPLPWQEALRVSEAIAEGLAHAHRRGVLHRDLKPANVFLCADGRVKLLDFGLAHLLGREGSVDGGTPAYMAPEQARGEPVTGAADVFAAARVLADMLPASGAPRPLGRAIAGALLPDPSDRPADGDAWLAALRAARRAAERPRRLRRVALLAAAFALVGIVAAGAATWRVRRIRLLAGEDGRVPVAVADFRNATGDRDLDGLSGLLIASLEQSKALRVLTRGRMWDHLREMGRTDVERIDEPLARAVATRAGAAALLLAEVRARDGGYDVDLRAVDPRRGEELFTVNDRAPARASLPALVDRLSDRAREALLDRSAGDAAARIRVGDAVTSSLEAFRHYFQGQQHWWAYRSDDAIREYQAAIRADPDFALAHVQLGYVVAERGGDRALVVASAERALAGADRLPPADRAFARAFAAETAGKVEEALRYLDEAIALRPDKDALFLAGELRYHRDLPGDAAAAHGYFARALEQDPSFLPVLDGMVTVLGLLGRTDELRSRAERWSGLPASVPLLVAVARARADLGEPDAAIAAARQAMGMEGGDAASVTLADVLLHAGRYAEAEAFLRARVAPTVPRTERRWAHFQLAAALAYQGRRGEALAVLDAVVARVEGGTDLPVVHQFKAEHLAGDGRAAAVWREVERQRALGWTGAWLAPEVAWVGDLAHAAALAEQLPAGSARERYHRAIAAWRAGRAPAALEDLRPLASERRAFGAFLRGAIAERAGLDGEAIEALSAFQRIFTRTRAWRPWCLPLSRVLLARALERRGDRDRAAAELRRLLADWARADPALPLLAEARAACARLGCLAPAR